MGTDQLVTGGDVDDPSVESLDTELVDLGERSTTPADAEIGTGNVALYSKTDGNLYTKPYGGSESQVGGGSGALSDSGTDNDNAGDLYELPNSADGVAVGQSEVTASTAIAAVNSVGGTHVWELKRSSGFLLDAENGQNIDFNIEGTGTEEFQIPTTGATKVHRVGSLVWSFHDDGGVSQAAQDLSALSLTSTEDGRIYRHDGANSISADGGTTSSPGYYAWDNSASEFKSIVQF